MGNSQPGSVLTRTTVALDSFVAELGGDIIFEKSLGSARFLKTVKCRHKRGFFVVKIFVKPDPGISLRTYHRRLKVERDALADLPNVYAYQAFVETDKAGYIIRQWIASSLYDRISTRPFLSPIEKKWIAFQLLNALRDVRNRSLSHGDIKSENVFVTSWNWVYLCDFASSYKPTWLPLDDPADFSFYFDVAGRRACYVAPERFYAQGHGEGGSVDGEREKERRRRGVSVGVDEMEGYGYGWKREGKVTEAMDVFSAGCVIAEMFLEGTLFTLSQLFKYREGEYKVDAALAVVEDKGVQELIKQMIHVNPSNRPTFDTLLHTSRGSVFPESFYSFLYNYVASLNELSSDALSTSTLHSQSGTPLQSAGFSSTGLGGVNATVRTTVSSTTTGSTTAAATTIVPGSTIGGTEATATTADLLPSDSDHRVERIWADYESAEAYITPEAPVPASVSAKEEGGQAQMKTESILKEEGVKIEYVPVSGPISRSNGKAFQDILPVELHIPNHESNIQASLRGRRCAAAEDGPALIILSILTANIRNCTLPSSKLKALDVFLALASHLTDEAKLDRMIPFVVELLNDEAALVRLGAVRCLMQVLMLVTVITPSNVSIFPEYIIPNIKHLVHDPDVSVRCAYAQCMSGLAETAVRYLEMGQALKAHGAFKLARGTVTGEAGMGVGVGVGEYESAYFEMSYDANMQELQSHIQEHLSTLLIDPSSTVKRAVLHDISSLCIFLGRQKTNDVLLSHMITYLNDRDWLLRYAFFESVVDVAACAGGRSLEEYILPLMVQALSDVEESVVARVLSALTSLCELGLFQKMRIWELMSATLGFLYHPNIWIRQGAAAFITAAGQHLPPSDIWCILYPSLRHFMKSDILTIDTSGLLTALKPPLPRQILDVSVQWAMKAEKSTFWRVGTRRVGTGMNQSKGETQTPRESIMAMRKGGGSGIGKNRSEEDEAQLSKLQQLGMTPSDENKLLAMRDYIVKLANATASFASRISYGYGYAGEDGVKSVESLKVVGGDVELQKLGVVPQTVFLKMCGTTRGNSRMTHVPPSRMSTMTMRTPMLSPRLGNSRRLSGGDHTYTSTGAPFEDLRRRLATINNGSTLSVQSSTTSRHPLLSPVPTTTTASSSSTPSLPPAAGPSNSSISTHPSSGGISTSTSSSNDRPPSPSESIVSTTSVSLRPSSRLQVGSTDNQKASPAVGSSRANATGVLEAHYKIRSEEGGLYGGSALGSVHEESGRSSPSAFSMSQTLKAGAGSGLGQRQRGSSPLAISTYDGQEPGISHLLENLYLDNNKDLQHDFGPKVHEGPVRRRNVPRSYFSTRDSSSSSARRVEANLIANLASHSEAITGLAVSPDHLFFVSSSDDKTVKVWDTARLERNVTSKSRQTYGQHHARVKCVCVLEGVHCFASAAEDGSLHVVRVHVAVSGAGALPKYSKLQVVREHRVNHVGEYIVAMVHYNTDTHSTLVYATNHSNIVILDLRTMNILQMMENPRHYGPITSFCIDKKRAWIVVGTSTGVLTLWDKRFGLLLRTWRAGIADGVGTGRSVRIHQCVVHPSSRSRGKWIMVALSSSSSLSPARKNNPDRPSSCLIEVWDIEKAVLVETYVTRMGSASDPVPELLPGGPVGQDVETAAAAAISALVRSSQEGGTSDDFGDTNGSVPSDVPHPPHCDVRAMVVGSDFGVYTTHQRPEYGELDMILSSSSRSSGRGFIVSGSEDAKIRLWDLGKFDKSTVLSGTESDLEKPSYSTLSPPSPSEANNTVASFVETWPRVPPSSSSTRASQRISLITNSQQQLLKNHQDVVTALTCIDSPFRGGIVSGDRAGVIKVWRVEQLDH